MKTCIKCGSHAFNLYAEGIDQGDLCDAHYWRDRAHRAEAQPVQERTTHITWDERGVRTVNGVPDDAPRPWVELTEQDMPSGEDPMFDHQYFIGGMVYASNLLKEKNT